MSITNPTDVVTAWLAVFAGRDTKHDNPAETLAQLAERAPGVTTADIVAAAAEAKTIGSQLRSLAHRVERAADLERRKNAR
jgi:hypothetical protein